MLTTAARLSEPAAPERATDGPVTPALKAIASDVLDIRDFAAAPGGGRCARDIPCASNLPHEPTSADGESADTVTEVRRLTIVIGSTRTSQGRSQISLLSGPPSRPPER